MKYILRIAIVLSVISVVVLSFFAFRYDTQIGREKVHGFKITEVPDNIDQSKIFTLINKSTQDEINNIYSLRNNPDHDSDSYTLMSFVGSPEDYESDFPDNRTQQFDSRINIDIKSYKKVENLGLKGDYMLSYDFFDKNENLVKELHARGIKTVPLDPQQNPLEVMRASVSEGQWYLYITMVALVVIMLVSATVYSIVSGRKVYIKQKNQGISKRCIYEKGLGYPAAFYGITVVVVLLVMCIFLGFYNHYAQFPRFLLFTGRGLLTLCIIMVLTSAITLYFVLHTENKASSSHF